MTAEFVYRCVSPEHRSPKPNADHITIHEHEWAFCPYDAMAPGHAWQPTGAPPLFTSLKRVFARRTEDRILL